MNLMAKRERAKIIKVAKTLDPNFNVELSNIPGRFERCEDRELAMAVETIANEGCGDQHVYADTDDLFTRVGNVIASQTADGFWLNWVMANIEEAIAKMDELDIDGSTTAIEDQGLIVPNNGEGS